MEKLNKVQLPWSVNSLANAAGLFIFKDKDFIKNSKDYIDAERKFMLKELKTIEGIKVFPTHTNYILIKLLDYREEEIFDEFLKNGILIRKCSSFQGLEGDYIRVAIKSSSNNKKIIDVFKKIKRQGE